MSDKSGGFCGIDFGTSNSTAGVYSTDGIAVQHAGVHMVPLELKDGATTMRSAIFFDEDVPGYQIGQLAIDAYLEGKAGRLLVALKSILGSQLMQEKTLLQGKYVAYIDILGCIMRHIKAQAELALGREITGVVLGRPVRFNDHDLAKDSLAEETLKNVAIRSGFKTVLFQYEPIAAAITYEENITREQIALIADLGGGTADFSIVRLRPKNQQTDRLERAQDVLANHGIHIGGTDFDASFSMGAVMPELGLGGLMHGGSSLIQVPNSYYYDLTTWHLINSLYNYRTRKEIDLIRKAAQKPQLIARLLKILELQHGHRVLNAVEQAKCNLSTAINVNLDLSFIEPGFILPVTQEEFEDISNQHVANLVNTVLDTVKMANIKAEALGSIFFTGGTAEIPLVRRKLIELFPNAAVVSGDVFHSVGYGLTLDAKARLT